jgi:hypothetical protein
MTTSVVRRAPLQYWEVLTVPGTLAAWVEPWVLARFTSTPWTDTLLVAATAAVGRCLHTATGVKDVVPARGYYVDAQTRGIYHVSDGRTHLGKDESDCLCLDLTDSIDAHT